MLASFSVSNFGPFRDEVQLNMQATASKDPRDNVIETDAVKGGLLSSSLVFGANASGKSYLLRAVRCLQLMVAEPYEDGFTYQWYEPFRLKSDTREGPTRLRIRLLLDGVIYDYGIAFTGNEIVGERLTYYPKRRPVTVFLRDGDADEEVMDETIRRMTSSSSSYLATAAKLNDEVCNRVRNAILKDVIVLGDDLSVLAGNSCDFIADDPKKRDLAIDGLRIADLGISDFSYTDHDMDPSALRDRIPPFIYNRMVEGKSLVKNRDISPIHDFTDHDGDECLAFPLRIESAGTRDMFGLMGPLVDALVNGKVILIDEFGSCLHPLITRWIVSQFRGRSNPNGAQLIASTHDIGLMDVKELVRRDQVWFTNKDGETGVSELYSLSDFKGVRKGSDVMRAYLLGRFDAIPSVRARDVIE